MVNMRFSAIFHEGVCRTWSVSTKRVAASCGSIFSSIAEELFKLSLPVAYYRIIVSVSVFTTHPHCSASSIAARYSAGFSSAAFKSVDTRSNKRHAVSATIFLISPRFFECAADIRSMFFNLCQPFTNYPQKILTRAARAVK